MSKKQDQRSRLKKKYHKDKGDDDYYGAMDAKIEEAAKLGCEVWELEDVKARLAMQEQSDEDDDPQHQQQRNASDDNQRNQSSAGEQEEDSDDAELAKMFGRANEKQQVVQDSSEDEDEVGAVLNKAQQKKV